jgi:3-phosphoshikimate 1-carboxyvinyltransferase
VNARPITPLRAPIDVEVDVPGSKSIANRALVCAALADGTSRLENVPDGDDTVAMLDCLDRLGLHTSLNGTTVELTGAAGRLPVGPIILPTRLAGTTSRFLTALVALGPGPYVIDGEAALRSRPMGPLHDALLAIGVEVRPLDRPGHLPVSLSAGRGAATASVVRIRGDVSSQYISALMMIAPYLPDGLRIELTTDLVSRPYVEMTASVMASFGHAGVETGVQDGRDVIEVAPGRYAGTDYLVEPDASSASYPFAAAAVVGGRARVRGLTARSTQSDVRFVEALRHMGCEVVDDGAGTEIRRHGPLHGITIDMRDFSDTAPTLAVVAAMAASPTRITGIGFIRGKESDRIGDVVGELRKCGVAAEVEPDGILVRPGAIHGASIATHHDHRIAMSFAVLGLVAPGMEIEDPDVVSKSYPGFWRMLTGLGE